MNDVKCKFCSRFLFKQVGTVVIEGLVCPNPSCRAKLNFKIVSGDTMKDINHKFVNPEQPPKSKQVEVS